MTHRDGRTGLAARRRPIALGLLSLALIATSSLFYLGATGSTSTTISPPAGAPSGGLVAAVTPITSTIESSAGAALTQAGVLVSEVTSAATSANALKVSIGWIDPQDAGSILNKGYLLFGLYHDVHLGQCNVATSYTPAGAPTSVTLTDQGQLYCALLDTTATGSASVSGGALLLSTSMLTGYLLPHESLPTTESPCGTNTANDDNNPCLPLWETNSSTSVLYLGVSVLNAGGGIPQGQQSQASTFSFFLRADAS